MDIFSYEIIYGGKLISEQAKEALLQSIDKSAAQSV